MALSLSATLVVATFAIEKLKLELVSFDCNRKQRNNLDLAIEKFLKPDELKLSKPEFIQERIQS